MRWLTASRAAFRLGLAALALVEDDGPWNSADEAPETKTQAEDEEARISKLAGRTDCAGNEHRYREPHSDPAWKRD